MFYFYFTLKNIYFIFLLFTEITMTNYESVTLTYEIGKASFTELPKTYEHGSLIEGKVSP